MNLKEKFDITTNEAECKLNEESAFEKLLQVLVNYGIDEDEASQMIADCIGEQYKLDEIGESLSNVYQEALDIVEDSAIEKKNTVLH